MRAQEGVDGDHPAVAARVRLPQARRVGGACAAPGATADRGEGVQHPQEADDSIVRLFWKHLQALAAFHQLLADYFV